MVKRCAKLLSHQLLIRLIDEAVVADVSLEVVRVDPLMGKLVDQVHVVAIHHPIAVNVTKEQTHLDRAELRLLPSVSTISLAVIVISDSLHACATPTRLTVPSVAVDSDVTHVPASGARASDRIDLIVEGHLNRELLVRFFGAILHARRAAEWQVFMFFGFISC
jgi:hypothetical protein